MQDLLLAALKANRQEYVELLLDEGVEIERKYLQDLYKQVSSFEIKSKMNSGIRKYILTITYIYKHFFHFRLAQERANTVPI